MDSELAEIITGKPMDYPEVLRYFGEKLELPPKEFSKLEDQYKTFAFTVGGYSSLQVVKAFHAKLTEAVANGTTLRDFRQEMDELLVAKGYEPTDPWAMENVFRTNLQTAYSVGAYQEMTAPAVLKNRPYWQYDAVEDDRTRPSHMALDGKVYPADDPIWSSIYPPNGFRCRCSVSSLSQRELEQQGLTVEEAPPGIEPDAGFNSNPAQIQFQPDLAGFPPALVKAYEQRERQHWQYRWLSGGRHPRHKLTPLSPHTAVITRYNAVAEQGKDVDYEKPQTVYRLYPKAGGCS